MTSENLVYDDHLIPFSEAMWGEGYMSPGGATEVNLLLDGIDLSEKSVVDIGSGIGGISLSLVRDHGAADVIGVDIDEHVCARARHLVAKAGLESCFDFRVVKPGPVPLADASRDIVFSKDAIVHIPDKEALAHDAFRMLRPGGWFVASDWLISHDDTPSPEMARYLEKEVEGFQMASPHRYRKALEDAGFVDITFRDRNLWFQEWAQEDLARLLGSERADFEAISGVDGVQQFIELYQVFMPVLKSGEHCPHHFRGRKPVN